MQSGELALKRDVRALCCGNPVEAVDEFPDDGGRCQERPHGGWSFALLGF